MSNELLESIISNVFGSRPQKKSTLSLKDLVERKVNAFVAICWKPGDFQKFFEESERQTEKSEYDYHDFLNGGALPLWDRLIEKNSNNMGPVTE